MYREGLVGSLKRMPELEVVGESATGREALEAIARLAPDVAVLDIQMAELDGVRVAHAISRDELATRTLLLSAYYDRQVVYDALAAGASGFLSKESTGREIADAVAAVARGETVLGRDIQSALADQIRRGAERDRAVLSGREREVLRLVAAGRSAPEVARELHVSTTTVKTHLQRAYEKLEVSDRAAAVAEAMRRRLLD